MLPENRPLSVSLRASYLLISLASTKRLSSASKPVVSPAVTQNVAISFHVFENSDVKKVSKSTNFFRVGAVFS